MNKDAMLNLMTRQYDLRRYNCFHFARDCYLEIVGIDIESLFIQDAFKIAPEARRATILLRTPCDPCLVLFSRPAISQTHIGVWYQNRVLHLDTTGARNQPLHEAMLGYSKCTYFKPRAQA